MGAADKFIQDSLRYLRDKQLVQPGQKVLVASSGGLDSSVLADLLASVARLLEIEIEIAHVDHRTRGQSSEREGTWVRVLAERLLVPSHALSVLPREGAAQAEFRDLRRQALLQLAADIGADVIATGHHADDNAETFLMRAMSGTGSRGLRGIPPKEGRWIRPLLWATRAELENYAREKGLAWVEDPSNSRGAYLRNRLRLEALPLLESVRAGSVRNLSRIAERLEDEERELDTWLDTLLEDKGGWLSLGWLERWPTPLRRRALAVWFRRIGVDYDPLLIESLLKGEEIIHPAGSFLRRSDALVFTPERDFGDAWQNPIPLELGRRVSLGSSMAWSFLPSAPARLKHYELGCMLVFRDPRTAILGKGLVLDWNRSPWPLTLRAKRAGEEKIDKILRLAGIPKPYWKHWPLLVSAENPERIVAVAGLEVLEEFRLVGAGRPVAFESFFEERLNALSHP
ncbi:MAG: tRNA lysidine(34) synthetase TilS [Bdellovibrionales bacterium]|nr:tRNA lysidine(34) synthetase TilS [Bdellovibrionales bacterium]